MRVNANIFREYDIRGVVERDLAGEVPELIGRAYGSELRRIRQGASRLTVALGRDNRPSSNGLAEGVARGLRAAGIDANGVGAVPTAGRYRAVIELDTEGGGQGTGTLNPPEHSRLQTGVAG